MPRQEVCQGLSVSFFTTSLFIIFFFHTETKTLFLSAASSGDVVEEKNICAEVCAETISS